MFGQHALLSPREMLVFLLTADEGCILPFIEPYPEHVKRFPLFKALCMGSPVFVRRLVVFANTVKLLPFEKCMFPVDTDVEKLSDHVMSVIFDILGVHIDLSYQIMSQLFDTDSLERAAAVIDGKKQLDIRLYEISQHDRHG